MKSAAMVVTNNEPHHSADIDHVPPWTTHINTTTRRRKKTTSQTIKYKLIFVFITFIRSTRSLSVVHARLSPLNHQRQYGISPMAIRQLVSPDITFENITSENITENISNSHNSSTKCINENITCLYGNIRLAQSQSITPDFVSCERHYGVIDMALSQSNTSDPISNQCHELPHKLPHKPPDFVSTTSLGINQGIMLRTINILPFDEQYLFQLNLVHSPPPFCSDSPLILQLPAKKIDTACSTTSKAYCNSSKQHHHREASPATSVISLHNSGQERQRPPPWPLPYIATCTEKAGWRALEAQFLRWHFIGMQLARQKFLASNHQLLDSLVSYYGIWPALEAHCLSWTFIGMQSACNSFFVSNHQPLGTLPSHCDSWHTLEAKVLGWAFIGTQPLCQKFLPITWYQSEVPVKVFQQMSDSTLFPTSPHLQQLRNALVEHMGGWHPEITDWRKTIFSGCPTLGINTFASLRVSSSLTVVSANKNKTHTEKHLPNAKKKKLPRTKQYNKVSNEAAESRIAFIFTISIYSLELAVNIPRTRRHGPHNSLATIKSSYPTTFFAFKISSIHIMEIMRSWRNMLVEVRLPSIQQLPSVKNTTHYSGMSSATGMDPQKDTIE